MATATANTPLVIEDTKRNGIGIIAADIIYEGSAVGDNGAGYARPLAAGDRFLGHCLEKVDNSAGSAGDLNVPLISGSYDLEVSLVGVITDVGQPVYMSDDTVYTFLATGNSYVGKVKRYVSATKLIVEFEPGADPYKPWGGNKWIETKIDNYTVDIQDSGKVIIVTVDAKTITLPAVEVGLKVTIVNGGAFGTIAVTISPNANDMIEGIDLTGADDKDIVNTKATARRGDFVTLIGANADGWTILESRGIWAREA